MEKHDDSAFKANSRYLLQLCCGNEHCITVTYPNKKVHKHDTKIFDKLLHCFTRFDFASV